MAGSRKYTFHNTDAAYLLPNDPSEHERLELQTRAINTMMHDQALKAPLREPSRMLDVGCGTGAMVLHMAKTCPDASSIIGVDLSPVPVSAADKPANVKFLTGDFKQLVQNPNDQLEHATFDFVFSRMLVYGMTDWPAYIAQATDLLKPGGWLELQEVSLTVYSANETPISDSWRWLSRQTAAFTAMGLDVHVGSKLGDYMRAAGLVDVHVEVYPWVIGHWEGHPETDLMGAYAKRFIFEMLSLAYGRIMKGRLGEEEIKVDLKEMREGWESEEDGMHMPYYVVWGRKPEVADG